jgi:hypothetical protein
MKKKKTPDKELNIFKNDNKQQKSTIVTIKTSLKSILKDYNINYNIINNMVKEMNDIAIISYLFIKLYILYLYKNNKSIPDLNASNIKYFIKACGKKSQFGKKAENNLFEKELNEFYDKEFKYLLNGKEKYNLINKSQLVNYLSIQMAICYKNNIKEHFITRIRRFMNLTKPLSNYDIEQEDIINYLKQLKFNKEINNITYEERIKEIKQYYKTYNDLWNITKNSILLDKVNEIPELYKDYALWIKENFLPSIYSKNYGYDAKTHPNKYLYYTLKMNDYIENKTKEKLFQSLSLRTSIIPSYITIDSATLIYYFCNGEKSKLNKSIKENKNYIWTKIFQMDKKIMNIKDYHIDTIQTDGIGVSLIFKKNGYEKYTKKEDRDEENILIKQEENELKYINDLNDEELKLVKTKKIISCDPGKHNLIYMLDEENNKLRYTAPQRRYESNKKRNSIILQKEKNKYQIIEEETKLSKYNCKTNNINKFKEYIKEKIKLNDKIKDFYENELMRKMKWRSFICKRRSEDKLLNTIEKKFGKKEDIIISYGNWNNSKQMKNIMPTLGIGMRKIIHKRFNVVLFDEFKTSKLCCCCNNELTNYNSLHRILICSNCKSDGFESKNITFINRDINACKNMLNLSYEWINNKTRKECFCRNYDIDAQQTTRRKRKTLSQ